MLKVNDRILIKEDTILGTDEVMSTIVEVTDYGYLVIADNDPEDWVGSIDFEGNVLQNNC